MNSNNECIVERKFATGEINSNSILSFYKILKAFNVNKKNVFLEKSVLFSFAMLLIISSRNSILR